jgi:hypothetical protein
MSKKYTALDAPGWLDIVKNIDNVMISDGIMAVLFDVERVLDEADLYTFKNWGLGELVHGPEVNRYDVSATFMWPKSLMPDPRGGKRLVTLGCTVEFKKTTVKSPIQIKTPDDFLAGTKYPKMIDRDVWLVNITVPKTLLNDIREGTVDLADKSIELEDLDSAYEKDYDDADASGTEDTSDTADAMGGMGADPMGGMGGGMNGAMGGLPPL